MVILSAGERSSGAKSCLGKHSNRSENRRESRREIRRGSSGTNRVLVLLVQFLVLGVQYHGLFGLRLYDFIDYQNRVISALRKKVYEGED